MAVISGFDFDYIFCKIESACYIKDTVFLILQKTNIIEFNVHLHSYIISDEENFLVVELKKLLCHMPLSVYKSYNNENVVFMHNQMYIKAQQNA